MATTIPVNQIQPNPMQPRGDFAADEINELAQSIRANGLINPLTVEQAAGGYILIAGERRLRAVKQLGWAEVPAEIREASTDTDRLLLALIENVQRADMRPVEEARAYQHLQSLGLSIAAIAHHTGKSIATITNRLRLLALDEEILDLVNDGQLPVDRRAADALLSIGDKEARVKLARRLARPGQSIQAVQTACANYIEAVTTTARIREDAPALVLARKEGKPTDKPQYWDSLKQLGRVPAWDLVTAAARSTCDGCSLREVASAATCRGCAAVELLARLVRLAENGGRA
jgi:ParB/RepB/Spo0J family partition protein